MSTSVVKAYAQHAHSMEAPPQHSGGPAADVVRDPAEVPAPIANRPPTTVKVELTAAEVVGTLDPTTGTTYRYWTFNGKVPGPMVRVREGDTVEVTLHNSPTSHMVHSLDFHAAIGPGGGAALSQVVPGGEKAFTFVAKTPGLFVYHCGTPMISDHIANGMYGLILVEPAGGLTPVDHEYYVMQGEIYTTAPKGKPGLQTFSEANLMKESPDYFVFNGAVDALTKEHPMQAKVGETVRIFFGDAGPNATSSLHVVGEIFTRDYQLGVLQSPPLSGVQTASIPPGGAAILELKAEMPGKFNMMDHAMARMAKGLVAALDVSGQQVQDLMHAGPASSATGSPQLATSGISPAAANASSENPEQPVRANATQTADEGSHTNSDGQTDSAKAAEPKATKSLDFRSSKAAQLDGCFTMKGAVAQLTLFHSAKTYAIEPSATLLGERPLAFADNINKLVHISGHNDRGAHLFGNDWFVAESIDQLASTCDGLQSIAQLRRAAETAKQGAHLENTTARTAVHVAGSHVVGMGDMTFLPAEITINAGESVTWNNTSITVHNVMDDAAQAQNVADVHLPGGVKPFGSGYLQPGQSYQRTFIVPGVYRYVCTLHETGGMKGTIVVKASGAVHIASADGPSRP